MQHCGCRHVAGHPYLEVHVRRTHCQTYRGEEVEGSHVRRPRTAAPDTTSILVRHAAQRPHVGSGPRFPLPWGRLQ